jgi:histidine triad (HIT) family protein
MENCVFCKIVNKGLPASIIFEDENFLAFPAKDAVAKGHTLLIPKKHFESIFDFETTSLEKLMGVAQKLAKLLTDETGATGINLLQANGKDAQQSVFHFHLHIVPRFRDDGLDLWFRNKL